ncbi:MAG: hypothetical protein K2G99_05825 [Desulfovibrio sp.]|nr:hypothetical protein [Desulfovibrio sp.]
MYGLECLLFLIVIAGLFDFRAPNGAPELYPGQAVPGKKLEGWNDDRLRRLDSEGDLDYAARMSRILSTSYYYCNYATRENLMELATSRFSRTWNEVGFLQPDRYCGFCHQASYILAKILTRKGIDAAPLGINGHVVVLVKEGGADYLFDPAYGVGPMPYKDDMTGYIPAFYGTDRAYDWLRKPFATSKDDDYFYSMQWLNDAEKEQNRALYIVKVVYAVCIVLFVFHTCFLLWTLFTRRRASHAQDTGAGRTSAAPATD